MNGLKPTKWNTSRLTTYGALGGLLIGVVRGWHWVPDGEIATALGFFVGGAVGGAAVVAIVSGIRNFLVRSN